MLDRPLEDWAEQRIVAGDDRRVALLFADGIRQLNDSEYGLQAGIFTNRLEQALAAFDHVEAGGVMINDVPTYRIDHMPYGGIKSSGLSREGVRYTIEDMTEPRLMVLNRLASQKIDMS